jgi:cellulose synthase/poly-beta-1,6-N-acetylglucosamine synthase-like glycosyltransferase
MLWDFIAVLLAVPTSFFVVECLCAFLPPKRRRVLLERIPSIAVLLPAHNEALLIEATLQALLPELKHNDRLVVVADNCTDQTAILAHNLGAEVLERCNTKERGKGYALAYGVEYLKTHPPEVVVIVDADCKVTPGALPRIATLASLHQRPVQALYLMEHQQRNAVSALAFMVKNLVRPRGLARLGMPCLLTGTGMAFPWNVLKNAPLASGNIVEDMQLGLDLAIAKTPPMFCEDARVTGTLPDIASAVVSQRTRWEHGHLQTLMQQVPRLLLAAFEQRRLDLLGLALEVSIPPLTMLVLLWMPLLFVVPQWALLALSSISLCIIVAWVKFGRTKFSLSALLSTPLYIFWKLPIYARFVFRRQKTWIRTERG